MTSKEWQKVKLSTLCKIKGGKRLPKGCNLVQNKTKHPYIRVRDLANIKNLELNSSFEYIEDTIYNKIKNYTVNTGDVIISIVGTIGLVSIIKESLNNANLTENCAKLINLKNINNNFLYYFLSSELGQNEIKKGIVGAVQQKLPLYSIEDISIPLPPLEIQEKIARVLSSLDDKIELNNKINQNLEQQADLLFNDLFLEDKDYIKLYEAISTTSGGTPSRKNLNFYTNGSFCWVKSKELNGSFINETEEKINQLAMEKSSVKLLPPYSVLVAMYGATVGEYAIISKQMTCNQAICAILPNEKYPYTYIYEYIKLSKEKIKTLAIGSAQQNISQILIKNLLVHKNLNKIKEYHFKTRHLFELIKNNQIENEKLTQLRDTLLPKLMSGEINVDKI